MNIQIFGKNKCFDTKKAERYFKERRIKYQRIDLPRFGISPRELQSVKSAVGFEALVNWEDPDTAILKYLAPDSARIEKLLDNPQWIKTPVVRNGGKQATVGFCPEVWKSWE